MYLHAICLLIFFFILVNEIWRFQGEIYTSENIIFNFQCMGLLIFFNELSDAVNFNAEKINQQRKK